MQGPGVYVALCVFAVAFGWLEATVVVYLRDLYLRDLAADGAALGLRVTTVALPARALALELVREACTMLMLGSVGWVSSRRLAGRLGAFLLTFGIWDLVYYAALRLVLGWPAALSDWDILFLIPVPWVAPVWAPAIVAAVFVAAGGYLIATDAAPRRYRPLDVVALIGGCIVIVGSFLVASASAGTQEVPDRFAWWIYWPGVALALAGFLRAEFRSRALPR